MPSEFLCSRAQVKKAGRLAFAFESAYRYLLLQVAVFDVQRGRKHWAKGRDEVLQPFELPTREEGIREARLHVRLHHPLQLLPELQGGVNGGSVAFAEPGYMAHNCGSRILNASHEEVSLLGDQAVPVLVVILQHLCSERHRIAAGETIFDCMGGIFDIPRNFSNSCKPSSPSFTPTKGSVQWQSLDGVANRIIVSRNRSIGR